MKNLENIIWKLKENYECLKSSPLEYSLPVQEIAPRGYHIRMQEFYSSSRVERNNVSSSIGLIAAVLAGDYVENDKKYWFWKDRIAKAEEMYQNLSGHLDKENKRLLGEMLEILNVNRYAKKKYGKRISKMCKRMGFKKKIRKKKRYGFFRRKKK